MQQRIKLISCSDDGTAKGILVRESACSGDCHKCSGCGAVQQTMVLEVVNPIGARPGDLVTIESNSGPVLRGAAILYLLPLVLFIVAYLLGMQWNLGSLFGAVAFVLSIALVIVYDRLVARKEETVYTIIGYSHMGQQPQ